MRPSIWRPRLHYTVLHFDLSCRYMCLLTSANAQIRKTQRCIREITPGRSLHWRNGWSFCCWDRALLTSTIIHE
ncbi:hypothetical protein FKM82_008726 [Ascaphus truei]